MLRIPLAAVGLILLATTATALPILPFIDTKAFAAKATDVLIAECLDPDAMPGPKVNGVTGVQVDVVKVMKGERKTGKVTLSTAGQPMEKGKRYMMASFGGSALNTGFLTNAELGVVEVPATFDIKTLDGKTLTEQIQMVFDARREQVRILAIQIEQEKKSLEKTTPKPPDAPKLMPPEIKFKNTVEGDGIVSATVEVTNTNPTPLPYLGYTSDSFEPKIPAGTIFPLHKIELRNGKEWKEYKIGWCGTGIGPVSIPAKTTVTFGVQIAGGEWQEVRVGVVWFDSFEERNPKTAWGDPIDHKELKK
jgi:hypothetical protein